ncbi:MAG: redox-sensing transcriptional repressor Rex [Leptolinea sp.]|nr:redox-sensing transcriptional repressor Rex [Leptolinea sp.]
MVEKNIPDIVISRLPIYLQTLHQIEKQGETIISSRELGELFGITAAQVRKDLSFFGEFGKQGSGYNIDFLKSQIRAILNIDRTWDVALIGAGDLGNAIARYPGFLERGFSIEYVFDSDLTKIGKLVGGHIVMPSDTMVETIRAAEIQIAMITVPSRAAQQVADDLVRAGVRAILNYAPVPLNVPENIRVETVNPIIQLEHMTYYIK